MNNFYKKYYNYRVFMMRLMGKYLKSKDVKFKSIKFIEKNKNFRIALDNNSFVYINISKNKIFSNINTKRNKIAIDNLIQLIKSDEKLILKFFNLIEKLLKILKSILNKTENSLLTLKDSYFEVSIIDSYNRNFNIIKKSFKNDVFECKMGSFNYQFDYPLNRLSTDYLLGNAIIDNKYFRKAKIGKLI